ncbi:MAG: GNAT family N-acetyltransferase [Minisyncoccia bacterium]
MSVTETTETRPGPKRPIEIPVPGTDYRLVQFTEQDAPAIYKFNGDNIEYIAANNPYARSRHTTVDELRESIVNPDTQTKHRLRFSIKTKDNEIVGTIYINPDMQDPKSAQIGFSRGKKYDHMGIGETATRTLTQYAFEELHYDMVYGWVQSDHTGSIRVFERNGYRIAHVGKEGEDNKGKILFIKDRKMYLKEVQARQQA